MTNLGTDKLVDLISQKHNCLLQLKEIGLRQLETARTGEMEMLMKLLAAKQRLIDQLTRIEQQLARGGALRHEPRQRLCESVNQEPLHQRQLHSG